MGFHDTSLDFIDSTTFLGGVYCRTSYNIVTARSDPVDAILFDGVVSHICDAVDSPGESLMGVEAASHPRYQLVPPHVVKNGLLQ